MMGSSAGLRVCPRMDSPGLFVRCDPPPGEEGSVLCGGESEALTPSAMVLSVVTGLTYYAAVSFLTYVPYPPFICYIIY